MKTKDRVLGEKELKERIDGDIIVGQLARQALLLQGNRISFTLGEKLGYKRGKQDGIEEAEVRFFYIRPKLEAEAHKAGIREVVEWLNPYRVDDTAGLPTFILSTNEWQAKLKEWGLE